MTAVYRIPALLLLLVCAIVFALIGSMAGMGIILIVALLFEVAFWFGLFKRMRQRK